MNLEKIITISVVTPSYNQGQFLEETLVSVLSQAGDFYLDYLIIDGGSNDDSVAIIKRYEKLLGEHAWDIRCRGITYRWVSEKDQGQTDALSKGFRLAKGEILAWLNSDDVYLPGTLQTIAAFFRQHPETALLYGAAYYCDPKGVVNGRFATEAFEFSKLAWADFICQPSTFFRQEAFVAVGGLDDTLHYAMDCDLAIRIGQRFDCRYLPQYLSKYRLHEEAKTMRNETLLDFHEEALHLALKYFKWAPLNRVYGACNYYCLTRLPSFLTRFRLPVIGAVLVCTVFRSLWLNRGLRREDLKLLNLGNFRKLFQGRLEILFK